VQKQEPLEKNALKIIDFGFACLLKEDQALSTKLGTTRYSSPQVFDGRYDSACDLWSCGVILFVLLSGQPPFDGKTDNEVIQAVKRGNFAFRAPPWAKVSEDAKELVRSLLKYHPGDRLSSEQALAHPWIQTWIAKPDGPVLAMLRPTLLLDLRFFFSQSCLRQAALHIVASQLGEEDTSRFRRAFLALDTRGAGILNMPDLEANLTKNEMDLLPPNLLQTLADRLRDMGGRISYTDFLAATLEAKQFNKEGNCRAAFRVFDRNNDGLISRDELEDALKTLPGNANMDVGHVLKEVDRNGDGHIDFQEFKIMLHGPSSASC